ncbi:MAG: helix-turn-helix domain-containing protein, partial [Spirochaetaceae bacterium]|nr:helix-turn-helix domain-containing protein [Spirochaetaceae bacterium]
MTNRQKIIKTKAGILEPARQSGNVSQARKATGHSRDSFYRFKTLYETGGEVALAETGGKKPNEKNRVEPEAEQAAADFAYERPAYGQLRASNELKKRGIPVSPGEVRGVRLRRDPAAFKGRLRALEAKTARENLMLDESRLAALERAKEEKEARGETGTEHTGYLGAQDTH